MMKLDNSYPELVEGYERLRVRKRVVMMKIDYIEADQSWQPRLAEEWGDLAARHMHFDDGFSILALHQGQPVGLIAVYWQTLPSPLPETVEGYIDIIEVRPGYRRRGIATSLVARAAARAEARGAYQLRAWSSEDKVEAIPMWRALGFGLCPAVTYPGGRAVQGYFVTRRLEG